jgi:prepilin-type N-terminal cleavage/methylation domain-containing protein/prepilin-type processing-associated H-X9-DG protein
MKRAFTLIELLVVIAIIAILAAILFPVFAQAKAAAKKTTAVSNLKQINLGYIMYENDYDDTTPILWSYSIPNPTVLPVELAPYIQKVNNQSAGSTQVNTAGVWADPSDSVMPVNDGLAQAVSFPLTKQTFVPPYATNGNGALYGGGQADPSGVGFYTPGFAASAYQNPANCFTFVETSNEASDLGNAFPGVKRPVDAQNPGLSQSVFRNVLPNPSAHYGGADCTKDRSAGSEVACSKWFTPSGQAAGNLWYSNVSPYAYADGHVKVMNPFASVGSGTGGNNPNNGRICDIIYPCGGWIAQGQ